MFSAERFKLACNCKLNETTTIVAGTPVKLLQVIGAKALIQIPGAGEQKIVDPQDLLLFGVPMWCYDMQYKLEEVDLYDNRQASPDENTEEFEGHS